MSVKLEVGKKYRDREGNIVEIVEKVKSSAKPFMGDDCCRYTPEGGFYSSGETKFDLIEEVSEGVTLRVNGKYRARNGEIVEIIRDYGHGAYRFRGDNALDYTKEGFFLVGGGHSADLIEEVTECLTLEVGHKYLTREGDVVEIIRGDSSSVYSFHGDNGLTYTKTGVYCVGDTNRCDIVSEYIEDTPKGKHFDDLTQIDVPFGELDESTQLRLKVAHYEGEYLQYKWERETTWFKKGNKTSLINTTCYRVKPKPTTHKATVQVDSEGNILKDTVQLVED